MKQTLSLFVLFFVTVLSVGANDTQLQRQNRAPESITGVWKGRFEQQPAVDIALKVESGKLVGTAVFYVVQNTDDGPVVKSAPKVELIEPAFDGRNLSVTVKRRDGSLFKATLTFIAENDAILKPADDQTATAEMSISLTREK